MIQRIFAAVSETIQINGRQFIFHPLHAAFWVAEEMLLIADVHFGKAAHFRKFGSAVPTAVSEENFKKLKTLVSEFKPKTICFLGDLFHSSLNNSWETFKAWVISSKEKIVLVSGNHDIIPKYLFEEIGVDVIDEWQIDTFLLTHHPTKHKSLFNICGHVHPGVRMQGAGRQIIKLPCFYTSQKQLILPAFGNFTGKHIVKPTEDDTICVIVENSVLRIS